ncbi:MAG: hypothetical protein AAGK14_05265 [Verrucomicrobiota bacterium]
MFEPVKPQALEEETADGEVAPRLLERYLQNQRMENLYTAKCYLAVLLLLGCWPLLVDLSLSFFGASILVGLIVAFYGYEFYVLRREEDSIKGQDTLLMLVGFFVIYLVFGHGPVLAVDGKPDPERLREFAQVTFSDYGKWVVIVTLCVYRDRHRAQLRWESEFRGAGYLNPAAALPVK